MVPDHPIQILIADDDPSILELVVEVYRALGFDITTAKNGAVALQKIQGNHFNIVLTDVSMPHATGLDVLKAVKDKNLHTVVILMSGQGTMETAIQALKLGANDYVAKPFDLSALQNVLEKSVQTILLESENRRLQEQISRDRDVLRKQVFELSILR